MKNWQKIGLLTLLVLLIAGVRIFLLWRERQDAGVQKPQRVERKLTDDDVVSPRKMYIDDMKSAKALVGKTVWIQAGYELEYYPYAGHVDYAHKVGMLPGAQPIEIKQITEAKAPASLMSHTPVGDKQILAVFTMPNDTKQYAVAIGSVQGTDSTYNCDQIFYYDDPHTLYKHWPADVWQSIDKHEAKQGMSELQTAMALGVLQQSDSSSYGNRTVTYDQNGAKWSVTFQNDKATDVKKQ
ncbi:hypothetical protein [Silvibacterium acidisoli]|uniref:hypothetical protein n=1 Tax=Acidobacteriaceae bacterium ZG23-2 TaxID=2883246 RepID=UPI00406C8093